MRENGEGSRRWFSVDSKSCEISVEGEGRTLKGFITEKRKGLVSWIHFGEEDLRNVLKGLRSPVMKEARPKGSLIGRRATNITSLKVEK